MSYSDRQPVATPPRLSPRLSTGQRVVLAYFSVAYFVPLIAHTAAFQQLSERPEAIYTIAPLTSFAVAQIVVVFGLFLIISRLSKRVQPPSDPSYVSHVMRSLGIYYNRGRLVFAAVSLATAVIYLFTGMNNFRYSTQTISESGSWLLIIVNVSRLLVSVDLFYLMFCDPEHPAPVFSRRYFENLLLTASLILSANGTVSMFMALATAAYSLFPRRFRQLVFVPISEPRSARAGRGLLLAAAVVTVFALAWISGESIKGSAAGVLDPINASAAVFDRVSASQEFAIDYFYYLIASTSTHYYSWLYTASADREIINNGTVSPIVFPLQTLLFRIDYLLGSPFHVVRPDVGSLSRLNYLMIRAGAFNDREGSSPGLLASFNYVFTSPFSSLFAVAYLVWMSRRFDALFRQAPGMQLSLGGVYLSVFFLAGVFQSPLDFVMVFDDVVVYMLLVFGLSYAHRPRWAVIEQPLAQSRWQNTSFAPTP